ncbi:RNA polymerase sigma factor [Methylovulum miyakonense]|uniref:RNA polymerase sigma factor n=1 Tax=Methylovulum miyakonense TaxID=645578 RepID=UPI00036DE3F2|nr:sigma-70 family RNA polymerase sigma factor [Methylovulum miyakonense]
MNSTAINADDVFLHHRHTLIHTIARIVDCPQTAEDLAQDTYLKFLQAAATQEITFPQSFLFQIGRNLALDHLRKQRIRQPLTNAKATPKQENDSIIECIAATTPTPEQIVTDQQQVTLLLDGLQNLSERRRTCLVLHRFHHWPYGRIATHLGISRSAVEKNIQAAVAHLIAAQDDEPC